MQNSLTDNLIFNQSDQTILLSVKAENVDLNIMAAVAKEKNLFPKNEFHITIIGKQTGEALIQKNSDFTLIKNCAEKIDWYFVLKNEFYFIKKVYPDSEIRSTIIQLIDIPSLSVFYQQLNVLTGENFPMPFPHITLFTNSTREENTLRGIGVYSQEDFEKLSPEHLL
jgi:hypothetical protein